MLGQGKFWSHRKKKCCREKISVQKKFCDHRKFCRSLYHSLKIFFFYAGPKKIFDDMTTATKKFRAQKNFTQQKFLDLGKKISLGEKKNFGPPRKFSYKKFW